MLSLSLEGSYNRIEMGIFRYNFTGINFNDYKTISSISYNKQELEINLRRYHSAREENINIEDIKCFCAFIFEY